MGDGRNFHSLSRDGALQSISGEIKNWNFKHQWGRLQVIA